MNAEAFRRFYDFRFIENHKIWEMRWQPTGYHYDVLRGLEYLRNAGVAPDAHMSEAAEIVFTKRDGDGLWPLENRYPGELNAEPGVSEGQPSRWKTLRAL